MAKYLSITLLAATLGACVIIGPAAAAPPVCAPGLENIGGTCVTTGLARSMRLRSLVMDQQKIGYNFPIPPSLDNTYPKNFDVNRFEHSQSGNDSTNPNPKSP